MHNKASQVEAFAGGIEKRLRWRAKTVGERGGLKAAEEYLVVQIGPSLPAGG